MFWCHFTSFFDFLIFVFVKISMFFFLYVFAKYFYKKIDLPLFIVLFEIIIHI